MYVQYSGGEQRSTQFFPRHLANFEGNGLQMHFVFGAMHRNAYFDISCLANLKMVLWN